MIFEIKQKEITEKEYDYNFKYWDKYPLKDVLIDQFYIQTNGSLNDNDDEIIENLYNEFKDSFQQIKNNKIYFYLVSHHWMEDTRINRYKGIKKEFENNESLLTSIEIKSEQMFVLNNKIRFSAIFKIEQEDIIKLLKFINKKDQGIFFIFNKNKSIDIDSLCKTIFEHSLLNNEEKMLEIINTPNLIMKILKEDGSVIILRGSNDWGAYYLEVFKPHQ